MVRVSHRYVIVVSQDCDLEQDWKSRQAGKGGTLPNVLFFHGTELTIFRTDLPPGSKIWTRVSQNKDERYQVLEGVPSADDARKEGVPDLGIDFKRYFTLSTEDIYYQVENNAQRRARLVSPYLEHFCVRAFAFQSRVALPAEHSVTGV